jgi:uncharacterized phage protein (TIGR02220 family)
MAGFFKVPHALYRAVCRDTNTLRVYLELASRARWTAGAVLGSHGVVQLAVGQAIMGRGEVAAVLDLTERAVRTAIDRLSALGVLTVETTKRGTVVTLRDYSSSDEHGPSERPSLDASNDQASTVAAANGSPSNEEQRSEEDKKQDRRERELACAAIDAINVHAGTRYAADSVETLKNARALVKAKVTPDDVRAVVAAKWSDWGGDDRMRPHFKPSTLLRPSKFARYLEDLAAGAPRRPAIAAGGVPPATGFGEEMHVPRGGARREESGLEVALRIARGES